MRGSWLRFWQKYLARWAKYYIPKEFLQKKNNPHLPAHIGVGGVPIGASGFTLLKCEEGEYHATQLYYDKWRRTTSLTYYITTG